MDEFLTTIEKHSMILFVLWYLVLRLIDAVNDALKRRDR